MATQPEIITGASVVLVPALELRREATSWPEMAAAVVIVDQATHDRAAEMLVAIAKLEDQIKEHHKEPKKKAQETLDAIRAAENSMLLPLKHAREDLKPRLAAYIERKRQEQIEADKKAQEAARAQEEQARVNLAVQAEEMGATKKTVNEILARPLPTSAPPAAKVLQKHVGVSARETWKAQVFDMRLLIKAVAAGKVSAEYIEVNQAALNRVAAALKNTMAIPGVRAYPETSVAVRRK